MRSQKRIAESQLTRRGTAITTIIGNVNEHGFIELISGRQQGTLPSLARFGLWCLSPFYSAAVRIRNAAYAIGVKRTHRVPVPVISVGNITTGGTGKTPVVAMIANWLTKHGRRPCLISRGYKAIDESGNDERRLLDRLCPGVPHIQNPDRVAASQQATDEQADVLVLDDGFQHRRLGRDLNLALIDATNPFGYDFILPRGLLREPRSGLHRADLILLTRCDQVDAAEMAKIKSRLGQYGKPIVEVVFEPAGLVKIDASTADFSSVANQTVGAFCGIGNPQSFQTTLKTAGVEPVFFEPFPDHSHYNTLERKRLAGLMREHQVNTVICTEKDLVKFDLDDFPGVTLLGVRIEAVVTKGKAELDRALESTLEQRGGKALSRG
jgi:tetraacyldisaccharide 4'-kinase